ncbi:hypothetical protein [Halarsenatibacter silvermanii]|uniref:Uncharacterized protein n=1 Tax=Halarsenatibacter silvermanii TaxID=321763 RepID=A0A1G9RCS0_9FIRM|nr:hypothetical protein [Halarsenatibacter silvermanii]SDM20850.1 hypothetical protein SAMN04488692_12135 [Halarsenatibacter silvermanii]
MKTVIEGNTVYINTAFYELDGEELVIPENVTLKVYDGHGTILEERKLTAGDDLKFAAGFKVPECSNPIVIEIEGIINGYETVERKAIKAVKVRDRCGN